MADVSVRAAARACLLASTALLALPAVAQAQSTYGPDFAEKTAQGNGVAAADMLSDKSPQIVIADPGTPTTARDPNDITGIGQMVIDQKNGFIGLCTGTLINPRTVIFAAHCVNEAPDGNNFQNPWNYGTGAGQLPIGFGFKANNLQGVRDWYLAGANQYKTNKANAFYNVNQVLYNPDSTKLGIGGNFLQGDVALASLDTPATGIPTWTLLFSQLPAPASISNTTGTGYHVIEAGYGRNGTGTTGDSGGIDYRRRLAENFIGILGSLDDIDSFLFGEPDGLPQNLYQLDFDDPKRGQVGANVYDFNVFKDNALPNEGITAGGDSGGPLILDKAYSKPTVIGVLSGGSRYFNAQRSSSYGTSSFYQPLYLFWDYIVANNPYRYVAAKAGDGNWTDPTHWVTALDPAYQIISGGNLVNGLPTTPGDGINGTSGKFGQVCYQQGGTDECYDLKTGTYYVNGQPVQNSAAVEAAPAADDAATVAAANSVTVGGSIKEAQAKGVTAVIREAQGGKTGITSIHEAQDGKAGITSIHEAQNNFDLTSIHEAQAATPAATAAVLPSPTLANGLPGATNFVPNNINPDAATQRNARYFDVTLAAAGTTTLSSAVTIDRFTISGTGSKLNVATGGSLTSLMEFNQMAGLVTVDGTVTSLGDYFLMSGGLNGSGRINAPFLTSVLGMIAPGTVGGIGTLTVGGNVVLSSGNILMIDLGGAGASDKLAVVANGGSTGQANVGGRVMFGAATGSTIRFGDVYTILTAQGGVTGRFSTAAPLSAILTPEFIYSANQVQARITAGLYANVVANTPVQRAYAQLLDQNRATRYTQLTGIYGPLDLQSAATIQSTLEGLAPRTETLKRALGTVALDNSSRFYRDHLAQMDVTGGLGTGGTIAMTGQPLQLAAMSVNDLPVMPGGQMAATDSPQTVMREGVLPETVSVFLAGGYIDGSSRPMPTAIPQGGRDQFDGWYAAAGIESEVGDNAAIGFGFSYTKAKGDTTANQQARGELFQGTLYGKLETPDGLFVDTQVSAGAFQARTRRNVAFVGTNYQLRSRDDAFALTSEVGLGKNFALGSIKVGPRIAGRVSRLEFTPTVETGGPVALAYYGRQFDSAQGRAGLALSGGTTFRPYATAYYVHDFKDHPAAFGANFVGGTGPNAIFALAGQDKDWAEFSGGFAFNTGAFEISLGADTTVARKDVKNQSYRGAIKVRF